MLVGICFVVLLQQAAGMSNISFPSLWTKNTSVQLEIINKHNDLRRMAKPSAKNMLKMTWNDEVARNAEKWANKCQMSPSSAADRRISFTSCGENLFKSRTLQSWSYAIQNLHDEVKNFKYGVGKTQPNVETEHYTQLVWATSHQLGCAFAYCPHKSFKYFYVCHYCPRGNILSTIKTPYKKGEQCEDCRNHCDKGLCTNACMQVNNIPNCDDLVRKSGCDAKVTKESCRATCECPSSIK